MTKPISKSKRQLAQLLIEAGVTQFPEGANWAAQDGDKDVDFFEERPVRELSWWQGVYDSTDRVSLSVKIPNWYQTVLSRDEFDQIVAETVVESESDSDGWIEWSGGECPVGEEQLVRIKVRGETGTARGKAGHWSWGHSGCGSDIIAYMVHKPEQAEPTAAPTLDQLLQDWRNADDYAQRKQTEADEAAAMRDERWQAVQARAGEMGVTVGRCESVVADDGWIEWEGGECPVSKGTFVDIRVRDGREELNLAANIITSGRSPDASCAFWQHDGVRGDIVAYRLARP